MSCQQFGNDADAVDVWRDTRERNQSKIAPFSVREGS